MTGVSVIGAGAWGTALAQVIATEGRAVTLWTRNDALAKQINSTKRNELYLGDTPLSDNITATSLFETALENDILLMVTPSQRLRKILEDMKPSILPEHKIVICSKGIELDSGMLMSEVLGDVLPDTPVAVLTGPNFAHEIAAGKPAGTTLACEDENIAQDLQRAVGSPYFRPYITHDVIGSQLAGALKNVIAISCGICHGREMGESARASLVTRGLSEIVRLGVAMGAHPETFLGLSGVGDMMLTCSSKKSRNFALGHAIGKGSDTDSALKNSQGIAEGYHTAKAVIALAEKHSVEMPICETVYKCLHQGLSLDEAIKGMLNRPLGYEFEAKDS